jgi:hypothetical protein
MNSLSYSNSQPVWIVGQPITPDTLTYNGEIATSFFISPTLSPDLYFNPQTGMITGTPLFVLAKKHYTVTGANKYNSDTAGIDITVSYPAPKNLTYATINASYPVGRQIIPNDAQNQGGAPDSFTVTPELPIGLSINKTSGRISGIPTQVTAAATFTITAQNSAGISQVALNIAITDTTTTIAAPDSLTYTITNCSYPVGHQIAVNTASYAGGAPDSFAVSPLLPAGLALNPITGAISGTPATIKAAASYTVTARNRAGSTQAVLTIAVTDTATAPVNRPPEFTAGVSNKSILQGDTANIVIIASDSDRTDTVTFTLLKLDSLKSIFGANNVRFATGIDTAWLTFYPGNRTGNFVFTVRISDKTDSITQSFTISVGNVNHPPSWKKKIIDESMNEGSSWSLDLPDTCSDPDSAPLTFKLASGSPVGDTIGADTVYRFSAGYADAGSYIVKIAAIDDSGLADTLTINLTVQNVDNDHTPPVIRLIDPASDSTTVTTASKLVKVSVKDSSRVRRVTFVFGTDSLATARSQDSIWSATVTGLHSGYNTISIVAWDSSANANKAEKQLTIKYDATATDVTPPVISLFDPAQDSTVISQNSRLVKVIVKDSNSVAAVWFKHGSDSISATKSGDTVWSATVTNLTTGYNSILICARDASTNANQSTKTLTIKYDPTLPDNSPPSFTRVSGPGADTTVRDSIITITMDIYDTSSLDTVYWTLKGAFAGAMTKISGYPNRYRLTDTLKTFHQNRLVIHAMDNSTHHNRDSVAMVLDYNTLPTAITGISPADTTTNVENIGLKFTWSGGTDPDGDSTTYIVRYGTDQLNLAYSGFTTIKQYTPPVQLKGSTQYFWNVKVCTRTDTVLCPPTGTYSFANRNHLTVFSLRMPDDTVSINDTIVLRITASDAEGIQKYRWSFDNGTNWRETSKDTVWHKVRGTVGQETAIVSVVDSIGVTTNDTANIKITNSAPFVFAGNDTSVGLHDLVNLHPTIRDDGKIVKYEWGIAFWDQFAPDSFHVRGSGDTSFQTMECTSPESLECIIRVTDDEQHVTTDTMKIISQMKWNFVSSGKIPLIKGASLQVFKDTIWIFGGDRGSYYNDSVYYSADGITWHSEKLKTPFDPLRYYQSSAVFNNKVFVIGGDSSDVWSSSDVRNWVKVSSSTKPFHQFLDVPGSALVYNIDNTNVLFFLGRVVWWSLDGASWDSLQEFVPGTDIVPYHASVVFHDTMWALGGTTSANLNYSTDGYTWNSPYPDVNWFSGHKPKAAVYSNTIWVFNDCSEYPIVLYSHDGRYWYEISTPCYVTYDYSHCFAKDNKLWIISANGSIYNTDDSAN